MIRIFAAQREPRRPGGKRRGSGTGWALALVALLAPGCRGGALGDSPHRVQVMLGFHSNFYHSWRGDTPDEAGFGTDIRVVRELLRMLDKANAAGLDARAYWDTDNLFTLEEILPKYAPDILQGIRARVQAGRDEVVLAPYDNGLFGAMTAKEMEASVRRAISNPAGSGVRDLFGSYTPLLRPNEGMLTTGSLPLLRAAGVQGLILAYSGWPFTTFSNFVPKLSPRQQYGATRLRLQPGGERTMLLPCVSVADVVNHISLEMWLRELRHLQTSGAVDADLLLHINFDSDVESWLPQKLPPGLRWLPNSGGLPEIIRAVNRYPWASFTTPGRWLATHPPVGEVRVQRDLADGAFDGLYSWAEKFPSHAVWTDLHVSRLAAARARAWLREAPSGLRQRVRDLLEKGRDSSFFQRLRGLSTTHFGMSTPLLNEERQAAAKRIARSALARARRAEALAGQAAGAALAGARASALAEILVRDLRSPGAGTALALLRVPLQLPERPVGTILEVEGSRPLPHLLSEAHEMGEGVATTLLVPLRLRAGATFRLVLRPAEPAVDARLPAARLDNGRLHLELEPHRGIASLRVGDLELAGPDFLRPFIRYRSDREPRRFGAEPWSVEALPSHAGLLRARMHTRIPLETPSGPAAARLQVDWTLPGDAPWIVADIRVAYPYTPKRDLIDTPQQKLRRSLDRRWVAVAPFPLAPQLTGTRERPLGIWKTNYLGVRSRYALDQARVNPANAELSAFNHHITAAWVAMTDGERGLLLAQDADVRSSFAFAPMRLWEEAGQQRLMVDPFGSLYGPLPDYTHLSATGLGTAFAVLGSSSLRPNGPSYNGEREHFSLLLAPYAGDRPPEALTRDAGVFFEGPALLVRTALSGWTPASLLA